mmetsp:Transcript_80628/g.236941  ORF Transcript_80628/g.236941 Transcript_80628/m.236941 type:complete len:203 (-) Transcript_80628:399-1007(-)
MLWRRHSETRRTILLQGPGKHHDEVVLGRNGAARHKPRLDSQHSMILKHKNHLAHVFPGYSSSSPESCCGNARDGIPARVVRRCGLEGLGRELTRGREEKDEPGAAAAKGALSSPAARGLQGTRGGRSAGDTHTRGCRSRTGHSNDGSVLSAGVLLTRLPPSFSGGRATASTSPRACCSAGTGHVRPGALLGRAVLLQEPSE